MKTAKGKGEKTLLEGSLYEDLWEQDTRAQRILSESTGLEEAREGLANYLDNLEWRYRYGEVELHPLEWTTALEAIAVFKNLISPRDEKIAGISTLEYLWRLARDEEAAGEVSEGFIEESRHLFRA
ncbi:TPA: KamA family radical SAM protein, partial [Candidatus Bipolaricaulota bacterium]|nr:KamA family radical SAM protein [Candidatus Bipolaricaulota bacterium]